MQKILIMNKILYEYGKKIIEKKIIEKKITGKKLKKKQNKMF